MRKIVKTMTLSAAAAVFSISLVGQSFAAPSTFTDINDISAKDTILALQAKGILSGVAPELFAPHAAITSAQSVQLIVNAFGLNLDLIDFLVKPKASDYVSKADNDAWYANALITASANGIELIKDMDPDAMLTREQFANELIRAMEVHGKLPMIKPVLQAISDQDQMNVEYSGSIQRGLQYGIIKLNSDGSFHPKENMPRADAAVQIDNAIAYLKAHQAPVEGKETLSYPEGVQLITDALASLGTEMEIKVDPDAKMTRDEYTYLLTHSLQTSGYLPMFKLLPVEIKDEAQIQALHSGMIQTALALDIVELDAEGNFHPQDEITRADAEAMIDKALEAVKEFKK